MKLLVRLSLATMVLGGMLLSGVVLAKNIPGGSGPDNLKGTQGADFISGRGGGDDIRGKNGRDHIYGDQNNDRLHGEGGNDWVEGGSGSDTAWGDKGKDTLIAEQRFQGRIRAAQVKVVRSLDTLLGGRGNDTIRAKNGKRDIIRGGPGRDKAFVDPVDSVQGVEVVPGSGDGPANNTPPVANDDSYCIPRQNEGILEVPPPGVLGNDTDADNNLLTAVWGTDVSADNTLTLNADGSFHYRAADPPVDDSFTYKANDGTADSNVATVRLTDPC